MGINKKEKKRPGCKQKKRIERQLQNGRSSFEIPEGGFEPKKSVKKVGGN